MRHLSGKTALITGASRGIGGFLVRALADLGMHLALTARSAPGLDSAVAEATARGARAVAIPADLAERGAVDAVVQRAEAELGPVSLLVNNAGLEQGASYAEASAAEIERILDVNLRAPMLLAHRVLPGMLERGAGHICNIASLGGLVGTPYNESYAASKHGLVGFSRGLRMTAQSEGWPVEVTVVCMGFIGGAGMHEDAMAAGGRAAPLLLGTTPVERVVPRVLRAIQDNRAESIVNPLPVKPLLAVSSLAPRFADWFAAKSGVFALFRQHAENRRRARL